jgi:biopolymer transport protein ExbD
MASQANGWRRALRDSTTKAIERQISTGSPVEQSSQNFKTHMAKSEFEQPDESSRDAFNLDAPSEEFRPLQESEPQEVADDALSMAVPPPPEIGEIKPKPLAWKGFEEDVEYEPEVSFDYKRDSSQDEMDMTPMVDVTFLLLIFFMVTASFASQRAAESPHTQENVPSSAATQVSDLSDIVEVIIDQNNVYRITSGNFEEVEAPSDIQMRAELRSAKEQLDAHKLLLTAHENAHHERVVKVLDYGRTLKFDEFQFKTTTQDY